MGGRLSCSVNLVIEAWMSLGVDMPEQLLKVASWDHGFFGSVHLGILPWDCVTEAQWSREKRFGFGFR